MYRHFIFQPRSLVMIGTIADVMTGIVVRAMMIGMAVIVGAIIAMIGATIVEAIIAMIGMAVIVGAIVASAGSETETEE
jgi:hypothetical protein